MRKLATDQRAMILSALVEGNSVNSTARICQCSKVTVLWLLADAGILCAQWHNRLVRNLQAERIQCDEAWAFVGGKDRAKASGAAVHGSIWTWIALDPDSKLVISYAVGDWGQDSADAFMQDLCGRLANRVQISTDGDAVYDRAYHGRIWVECRLRQDHQGLRKPARG